MAVDRLTQMGNEWRKTDAEMQTVCKKNASLTAEMEGLTREYNAEHSKRQTLEGLAKDLTTQKQNLYDQATAQAEEEKQKRVELTKGLQAKLEEINTKVESTERERMQLTHDNNVLKEKLKVINEYLENKDKQHAQILEQKSKEVALYHEHMEERISEAFKSITPQNSEGELKSQLSVYQDKFDEFQQMIGKSTQVFDVFKGDMAKLTERLAKADSEQGELRRQCDAIDVQMVNLIQTKTDLSRHRSALQKEKETLEAECRSRKTSKPK